MRKIKCFICFADICCVVALGSCSANYVSDDTATGGHELQSAQSTGQLSETAAEYSTADPELQSVQPTEQLSKSADDYSEDEVGLVSDIIRYQDKVYYGIWMEISSEQIGELEQYEKIGQIQGFQSGISVDGELYTNTSERYVGNDVYMGEIGEYGLCFVLSTGTNECDVLAYAKTETPEWILEKLN